MSTWQATTQAIHFQVVLQLVSEHIHFPDDYVAMLAVLCTSLLPRTNLVEIDAVMKIGRLFSQAIVCLATRVCMEEIYGTLWRASRYKWGRARSSGAFF